MLLTEFDEKKYRSAIREEGAEDILISLVKKNKISMKDAADELKITEDEFAKML